MDLILLGPPGSGKGTQAERLEKTLGLLHVATGDLFRQHLAADTELGRLARQYIDSGQLVPDDLTISMVRERLEQPDAQDGVLFDGFPRTIPQAEALDQILAEKGRHVSAVIHLVVPDEEIVRRLSRRLICRECQTPFHLDFNPFTKCPFDKCNGEYLYQREDDRPEVVRSRLKVYHQQTRPLVEYYRERKLLVAVPGEGQIDQVTERILGALESLRAP